MGVGSPVTTGRASSGATVFDLRVGLPSVTGLRPSGFHHPHFEHELDKTTGSLARADNLVKPLFDGQNSFAERAVLIAAAKTSIHLQTFFFADDDTGWDLARSLVDRAKAGIAVRVIIDGLGCSRADPKLFEMMREGGVDVRAFETGVDLLSVNNRWHEKHLVIDGKVAIEGGMNIADEYAFGGSFKMVSRQQETSTEAWSDVDVRVEGAAVHDVQRAFVRNWALLGDAVPQHEMAALFAAPTKAPGGPSVRVVQHHPHGDPPDDHTMQLYLRCIRAATRNINIETAYFVPPKALREALIDAARRGVEVKVMTNSKGSSDMGFVVDAARYFYDELVSAGVKIHEKTGGTLHSKTATFDGAYSIIGSCNLNGRSDGRDTESVVGIRDDKTAAALVARFAEGSAAAHHVSAAELNKDSFVSDLKQWAISTLAWTL